MHDLKLRINNDTSLLASEYVRVFWKYGENSTLENTAVWGLETLPPHDETLRASPLQESTVGENYQALQRSYHWQHGGTSRVDYYVVNNNQAMMLVFQARDFSP
ncbi:MAG: hypothetical protein KDD89_15980, partial [Anaerolineales bacterium]|nr:hypothetical protein [Anaerolineales bacterium]